MSFGTMDSGEDNAPLAEINMVPLIDVMLVLLVIFLVTAPLLTHAVKVDLPKASSTPNTLQHDVIELSIDAANHVYWNGRMVDGTVLNEHLLVAAAMQPQPALHIRAERSTSYEKVAHLMSDASRAGLSRLGFVTEPSGP
jgi:biopolymer transport protein ExbD